MTNRTLTVTAALVLALAPATVALAKPVQVTRFATPEAIVPGPAAPMKAAASLEQSTYDAAVARELARIGFEGTGTTRYDYTAEVTRDVRRDPVRRSPVTIGIGGGTGGWGGGFGIGGSFGVGSQRGRDTTFTRLFVQLRDRATGKTVWEGRAETESSGSNGERIERLAEALFRDFPGQTGRTISVK